MKKIINSPGEVVRESMQGLSAAHPDLVKAHYEPNFLIRADAPVKGKVALISGGGSGHEPLHSGYVGKGMLDAACPGNVFTSPTPDQMTAAAKAVSGNAGILFIVKNYTGDVLNFEMASEFLQEEGIKTTTVITNDDVAVQDSLYTAGRRGVGITVFAEKIAGAAAERGLPVEQVTGICSKVNERGRSMGIALTSCTVPEAGKPTFEIGENEIEVGIGIHGEPGRIRTNLKSAHEIAAILSEPILTDLSLQQHDSVIVLVNGMGGTPLIELYLLYNEVEQLLNARKIQVVRRIVGNYITSLEMAGCSLTILKTDEMLTSLWDDPVHTPALRWGI